MSVPVDQPLESERAPPKSRAKTLVVVVVIAVLVAVIGVYVILLPQKPTVVLGSHYAFSQGWIVNVTSARPEHPLSDYTASLALGSTSEGELAPLVNGTANGALIFFDVDQDNRLSAGDAFGTAPLAIGNHTLTLKWRNGPVATRTIKVVPSSPLLTLSTPTAVTNGFQYAIAGASQSKSIANYKVNFLVGTTAGTTVTLAASMTFTIGGNTYTVTYTDVGGEGSLTGGDIFTVTKTAPAGPLTVGTTYHVLILWSDSSQIADASYTA